MGYVDIFNANQLTLDQNSGTLPDLNLREYFQPMTFDTLVKTIVNFNVVETKTTVSFQGIWQPSKDQRLDMKPHGQRDWVWITLHSDLQLALNPDDVVIYHGAQYRVMSKKDFSLYQFIKYELVNDYTGSGP